MSACARMNRLFAADGKCFVLAVDHGFYNVGGFLTGIEDMPALVAMLAKVSPDAFLLSVGHARLLQDIPGPRKPALVLRSDTNNLHVTPQPQHLFSMLIGDPVGQALALDAACVVVNLLCPEDHGDVHQQCVENACALKAACAKAGMPLMIEPMPLKRARGGKTYQVDGSAARLVPLVRQAVELGADVLKVPPTDDLADYRKVIETASGVPLLLLGGGRVTDREILDRTASLMKQGAKGLVYGRNVTQHPNPAAMCRAFVAMVHDGATAKQALAIAGGK